MSQLNPHHEDTSVSNSVKLISSVSISFAFSHGNVTVREKYSAHVKTTVLYLQQVPRVQSLRVLGAWENIRVTFIHARQKTSDPSCNVRGICGRYTSRIESLPNSARYTTLAYFTSYLSASCDTLCLQYRRARAGIFASIFRAQKFGARIQYKKRSTM